MQEKRRGPGEAAVPALPSSIARRARHGRRMRNVRALGALTKQTLTRSVPREWAGVVPAQGGYCLTQEKHDTGPAAKAGNQLTKINPLPFRKKLIRINY